MVPQTNVGQVNWLSTPCSQDGLLWGFFCPDFRNCMASSLHRENRLGTELPLVRMHHTHSLWETVQETRASCKVFPWPEILHFRRYKSFLSHWKQLPLSLISAVARKAEKLNKKTLFVGCSNRNFNNTGLRKLWRVFFLFVQIRFMLVVLFNNSLGFVKILSVYIFGIGNKENGEDLLQCNEIKLSFDRSHTRLRDSSCCDSWQLKLDSHDRHSVQIS